MEETKEWCKDTGIEEKGFVFLQVKWLKSRVFPNTHKKSLNFPIIYFFWNLPSSTNSVNNFYPILFPKPLSISMFKSRYICISENFYNLSFLENLFKSFKV